MMPMSFEPQRFWRNLCQARYYHHRGHANPLPVVEAGVRLYIIAAPEHHGTVVLDVSGSGRHSCACWEGRAVIALGGLMSSLCAHVITAILAAGRDELLLPYTIAGAEWLAQPGSIDQVCNWQPVTSGVQSNGRSFTVRRKIDLDGEVEYRRSRP